jgi:hypothetical protein
MLQHIVLFAFPQELSDEDYVDMTAQIASWPVEIGGIRRIGPPAHRVNG